MFDDFLDPVYATVLKYYFLLDSARQKQLFLLSPNISPREGFQLALAVFV